MAQIKSSSINSFPSTKRASVNKLMTENSITRLINRLLDVDGYVITNSIELNPEEIGTSKVDGIIQDKWTTKELPFEFSIRGYYFCIDKENAESGIQNLINQANFKYTGQGEHTLTAYIFIDTTDKDYPELHGQDIVESTGAAAFITFLADGETPVVPNSLATTTYEMHKLDVLKYVDGTYFVPYESLFMIDSRSIATVDGGEVFVD